MSEENLVVVRTFLSAIEANFAHSVLEAANIQAFVRADDCGGVDPALQLSGVSLIVDQADLDEARRVLDTAATPVDSQQG